MATKNQAQELLDLALHPVRMRILTLLTGSDGLTPQQMAERMNDVPAATLYRHINRLAKAGLLQVVEQRPVRGTVEKVYAVAAGNPNRIQSDSAAVGDFNRLSDEDQMRYFTAFTMSLMDDFSRYLKSTSAKTRDMAADGVGYHKLPLFLSDEEFKAFAAALNQALLPFVQLKPEPGRTKRLFTTVMMPSTDPVEKTGETEK